MLFEHMQDEWSPRASEQMFQAIFMAMDEGAVLQDERGKIIAVNPAAEKMLGLSAAALIGQSSTSLAKTLNPIQDNGSPYLAEMHPALLALGTGKPQRNVHMGVHRPDDTLIWISINAQPLFSDGESEPYAVITTFRDVTEHKQMEERLRASEQQFRNLAENLPDSFIRYDRDGCIRYLNSGLLGYLGLSANDVIGKRPGEVWPDGRYAEIERANAKAMATGETSIVEFCEADATGVLRFNQVLVAPERDGNGQIFGTLAIGRDVTAIRETERKLSLFVENLPGMAYTYRLSPDGHASFPYISPAIEKHYGIKSEDVKDDIAPLHNLWHSDDRPRIEAAAAESARTMTPLRVEARICRPGQPVRWQDVRSVPMMEADGSILWHGLMLDITERKQAEIALMSSQRMLSEAQAIAKLGSWDWDVVRNRVEWSDMAYDIYTPDERPAAPGYEEFKRTVHPDDLKRVDAAVRSAFEHDTPFDIEHRVVSQSKGVRTVHAQAKVFRDHNNNPVRMVGTVRDITEQKSVLDIALRYQDIFENVTDGVFVLDVERDAENVLHFRFAEINPAMVLMGRLYQGNVLGRYVEECVPEDAARKMNANYCRCVEAGKPIRYDFELEYPGGIMIFDSALIPMLDGRGDVCRLICVTRDISERKRAERERQAHAYSLACMDQINQAILGATDLEQMMSDVLNIVLSIFDCDRAFLVHPCDPDAAERQVPMERTRPEYPGALALGKTISMTNEVALMSRIALDTAAPVVFGPGAEHPIPSIISEVFGVKSIMLMTLHPKLDKPWQFGIHQCSHVKIWTEDEDVLFQKIGWRLTDALTSLLMYRNLRDSEQKYRSLADNIPLALVRYDREGRRTYVNPSMERSFGVPAERIIGKTLEETNPILMTETYRRALQHTLATGENSEFEIQLPAPVGEVRTGIVLIAAECASDGEISGAIAIGRDITALKQAENQLRELNLHLLTVREEEKAYLAREIHDELGSTLASLKIQAYFLQRDLSADPEHRSLVARIESISQLLDGAIDTTRRIATELRPTMLDTLGLFAALKWHADQFNKHTGIECRVECISAEDNGCIRCNGCNNRLDSMVSISLFRIYQEALTNVARHSGASRVETEFQFGNNEVSLAIRDNGCGFLEGDAIAATSNGMRGMRERVQPLGGEIVFDSPAQGGFCVTVKLPSRADAGMMGLA